MFTRARVLLAGTPRAKPPLVRHPLGNVRFARLFDRRSVANAQSSLEPFHVGLCWLDDKHHQRPTQPNHGKHCESEQSVRACATRLERNLVFAKFRDRPRSLSSRGQLGWMTESKLLRTAELFGEDRIAVNCGQLFYVYVLSVVFFLYPLSHLLCCTSRNDRAVERSRTLRPPVLMIARPPLLAWRIPVGRGFAMNSGFKKFNVWHFIRCF